MGSNYKISDISDGQYEVEIDLSAWMNSEQIETIKMEIDNIQTKDEDFTEDIVSLNGEILKYKSESLFPKGISLAGENLKKKKVMIIAGNPATHSVAKGMFFYSKTATGKDQQDHKFIKHHFWGKLEDAGLMPLIKKKTLEEAAKERKELILKGTTSDKYLLGLTTFYSFPTAAKKGVDLVERLFKDALPQMQHMEYQRLISYPFSPNAVWVFMQNSSYRYVHSFHRIDYWPLMFGGSSGKDLQKILQMP